MVWSFLEGWGESGKGQWGNSWLVIWREKYACVCILPPALQRLALCCNTAGNSRESWRVPSSPPPPPPPFCWCVMFFLHLSPSLFIKPKFRLAFRPLTPSLSVSLGISALLWQSQPEGERKGGGRWGGWVERVFCDTACEPMMPPRWTLPSDLFLHSVPSNSSQPCLRLPVLLFY